ncbi:MAG: hypothetical protein AAGA42_17375 [Actinomycetota bacterium]
MSIGDVPWSRVVDGAADLPRATVGAVPDGLVGRDDDGSLTCVSTAGTDWSQMTADDECTLLHGRVDASMIELPD